MNEFSKNMNQMQAKTYTNYDFGQNWDNVIVPIILKNFKKWSSIIEKAVSDIYLNAFMHKYHKKYKMNENVSPAEFSCCGAWHNLVFNLVKKHNQNSELEALLLHSSTFEDFVLECISKNIQTYSHNNDDEEFKKTLSEIEKEWCHICKYNKCLFWPQVFTLIQNYEEESRKILGQVYNLDWNKNKTHICFYIMFGLCRHWNPTVNLWLAQKIFPKYKWKVRRGDRHTTVLCEEKLLVFDMIYWGLNGRYENVVFPDSSKLIVDPTLGASVAIEWSNTAKKIH